jgi:antitoxin CptB
LRMVGRTGLDSHGGDGLGGQASAPHRDGEGRRNRAMTDSPEQLNIERKRLKFRSWHRGTREMDLLLGRFADGRLDSFDAGALRAYAALLEQSDPDIYDWVCGRGEWPEGELHPIIAALTEFHSSISS